jgi:hypothetical protein
LRFGAASRQSCDGGSVRTLSASKLQKKLRQQIAKNLDIERIGVDLRHPRQTSVMSRTTFAVFWAKPQSRRTRIFLVTGRDS